MEASSSISDQAVQIQPLTGLSAFVDALVAVLGLPSSDISINNVTTTYQDVFRRKLTSIPVTTIIYTIEFPFVGYDPNAAYVKVVQKLNMSITSGNFTKQLQKSATDLDIPGLQYATANTQPEIGSVQIVSLLTGVPTTSPTSGRKSSKASKNVVGIAVGVSIGGAAFIICVVMFFYWYRHDSRVRKEFSTWTHSRIDPVTAEKVNDLEANYAVVEAETTPITTASRRLSLGKQKIIPIEDDKVGMENPMRSSPPRRKSITSEYSDSDGESKESVLRKSLNQRGVKFMELDSDSGTIPNFDNPMRSSPPRSPPKFGKKGLTPIPEDRKSPKVNMDDVYGGRTIDRSFKFDFTAPDAMKKISETPRVRTRSRSEADLRDDDMTVTDNPLNVKLKKSPRPFIDDSSVLAGVQHMGMDKEQEKRIKAIRARSMMKNMRINQGLVKLENQKDEVRPLQQALEKDIDRDTELEWSLELIRGKMDEFRQSRTNSRAPSPSKMQLSKSNEESAI
jgi:hypothetical protein